MHGSSASQIHDTTGSPSISFPIRFIFCRRCKYHLHQIHRIRPIDQMQAAKPSKSELILTSIIFLLFAAPFGVSGSTVTVPDVTVPVPDVAGVGAPRRRRSLCTPSFVVPIQRYRRRRSASSPFVTVVSSNVRFHPTCSPSTGNRTHACSKRHSETVRLCCIQFNSEFQHTFRKTLRQ